MAVSGARLTLYPSVIRRSSRTLSIPGRVKIAHEIAAEGRGVAPMRSGRYRSGIGVETSGTSVRVVNNDDDAIHKEYGTSKTPAHAAITNAAMRKGKYSGTRPRGGR